MNEYNLYIKQHFEMVEKNINQVVSYGREQQKLPCHKIIPLIITKMSIKSLQENWASSIKI